PGRKPRPGRPNSEKKAAACAHDPWWPIKSSSTYITQVEGKQEGAWAARASGIARVPCRAGNPRYQVERKVEFRAKDPGTRQEFSRLFRKPAEQATRTTALVAGFLIDFVPELRIDTMIENLVRVVNKPGTFGSRFTVFLASETVTLIELHHRVGEINQLN